MTLKHGIAGFAILTLALTTAGCRQNVDCGPMPQLAPGELPAPKVLPYLTCQAEGNDSQLAQDYLGTIYDEGTYGVPQNYAVAAKWYEKAAKERPGGPTGVYLPPVGKGYGTWIPLTPQGGSQGSPHAQFRLGVFYRDGLGVLKDVAVARRWLEAAARQGYQPAIAALAQLSL